MPKVAFRWKRMKKVHSIARTNTSILWSFGNWLYLRWMVIWLIDKCRQTLGEVYYVVKVGPSRRKIWPGGWLNASLLRFAWYNYYSYLYLPQRERIRATVIFYPRIFVEREVTDRTSYFCLPPIPLAPAISFLLVLQKDGRLTRHICDTIYRIRVCVSTDVTKIGSAFGRKE